MKGRKTVLLVGTCDTKGEEIAFMKDVIESENVACMVMDIGLMKDPAIRPDITRRDIAVASGHALEDLVAQALAGRYEAAVEELASGAGKFMTEELLPNGTIDGVIAIGGSMGTAITLKALRSLPIGFPKMLISTVALSDYVHPMYIQSDIMLVQPISDFCSLNDWSKRDLQRAALSMASIVSREKPLEDGPWIGITTTGWTHYVPSIKERLEKIGFKVSVSHSVSMQGSIMEQLIRQGVIKGFLDLCPFEITHEIAGGSCNSRDRMQAAAEVGIPQIVSPGMWGLFTMPTADMARFAAQGRFTVPHNEILGTARMNFEEMVESSKLMASRLNKSTGPVTVVVPAQGFHHYDRPDKMYDNPEGRRAFIEIMKSHLKPNIELIILDCHINDQEFTERVMEVAFRLFNGISRDSIVQAARGLSDYARKEYQIHHLMETSFWCQNRQNFMTGQTMMPGVDRFICGNLKGSGLPARIPQPLSEP